LPYIVKFPDAAVRKNVIPLRPGVVYAVGVTLMELMMSSAVSSVFAYVYVCTSECARIIVFVAALALAANALKSTICDAIGF